MAAVMKVSTVLRWIPWAVMRPVELREPASHVGQQSGLPFCSCPGIFLHKRRTNHHSIINSHLIMCQRHGEWLNSGGQAIGLVKVKISNLKWRPKSGIWLTFGLRFWVCVYLVCVGFLTSTPLPTRSCVEALLDARATVDPEAPGGHTPLYLASQAGSPNCVRLLLGCGADRSHTTTVSLPKTQHTMLTQQDMLGVSLLVHIAEA